MKVYAIKTNQGVMISSDPDAGQYGGKNPLLGYKFDGEYPEKTFCSPWVMIKRETDKCHKLIPATQRKSCYQLREGFPVSDKTPAMLPLEHFAYDDDAGRYEPNDIYGLYDTVCEDVPETLQEECLIMEYWATVDNVQPLQGISIPATKKNYITDHDYNITEKFVQQQVIDKIVFPQPLLALRPCKLSSKQSFDIIRHYIRRSIDPKVARITTDYDFCLEVQKDVELTDVWERTFSNGNTKKPKYRVEKWKQFPIKIYKCAPMSEGKVHSGYPQCPSFEGQSYDDLMANIDKYLADTIEEINKPTKECEHCKGYGVIFGGET